jgi:hypothetical protein
VREMVAILECCASFFVLKTSQWGAGMISRCNAAQHGTCNMPCHATCRKVACNTLPCLSRLVLVVAEAPDLEAHDVVRLEYRNERPHCLPRERRRLHLHPPHVACRHLRAR